MTSSLLACEISTVPQLHPSIQKPLLEIWSSEYRLDHITLFKNNKIQSDPALEAEESFLIIWTPWLCRVCSNTQNHPCLRLILATCPLAGSERSCKPVIVLGQFPEDVLKGSAPHTHTHERRIPSPLRWGPGQEPVFHQGVQNSTTFPEFQSRAKPYILLSSARS